MLSKLLAGWWLFWSCVTGIRGALHYLAISLWRPPLRRDTRICLYSLTGDETFCLALGLFLDDDEYQQIYWEPERKKIFGYLKWRSTLYVIFTTQHFEHKLVFNRGSKRWDLESGLKTPREIFFRYHSVAQFYPLQFLWWYIFNQKLSELAYGFISSGFKSKKTLWERF